MIRSDTEKKKEEGKKKKNRLESHLEAHVDVTVLEGGGDVRWRKQGMSLLVVLANSAATFHLHTRVNAQPALCALSFSRTLQKPAASLGVKWLLP